ncbi:type 1 periplasmic-binding domain-containing protein [Filimonas effusa]|uniref:Amino acid ABC transporter substrate-binding protein n=1 Tax=Filimonas effusa TaxID=2508721 RepID=A0A4Q1DCP3_9BACT|nr:hypothetical protein [Filimonas effusa]RXK87222.1 hypothetical protein ESB13_10705 [Filimonas effusa]
MNPGTRLLVASAFLLCSVLSATAQQETSGKPMRVAVLAPLYLDSAFNGFTYKLGSSSIPKYILPGLDFYNGVMLAVDSLQNENMPIEVWVYDTKKLGQTIPGMLSGMEYLNFSLIVASFNNTAEQKLLSEFSFRKNIPVISATYPNDAGLNANPFFMMVNSTLKTHVEALHSYTQKNYAGTAAKLLFVTKPGPLETKIKSYFAAQDALAGKLNYKVITLTDNFTEDNLLPFMDSTRQNIIICGSVNEAFGSSIVRTLNAAPSYRTVAIGMPTWDGLKEITGAASKNIEIVYSTPYNFSRTDKTGSSIVKQYRSKYMGRPSDMVFKGFESMYHFSRLMLQYRANFINNVSDSGYKIANSFRFEPVRLTNTSFVPDYLENKKLYFVKVQGGVVKSVN